MEPRIQYAITKDGVRIAYWAIGDGPGFIEDWGLFSHLQLEWQHEGWRAISQRRAQTHRYVRFNHRGSGLSERNVTDFSLDALVLDLQAVVSDLGLERFALAGLLEAGPVAVAYAALHPAQVSRLILWGAWARGPDASYAALRSLRDHDWSLYLDTYLRVCLGWPGERADGLINFFMKCVDPGIGKAALAAIEQYDVSAQLRDVRCPTLVFHHLPHPLRTLNTTGELTSGITGARLQIIEDGMLDPVGWAKFHAALDEFLNEDGIACPGGLTPREVDVLRLIAAGRSNREIAEDLTMSVRTVGRHVSNIYSKIGAHRRAEATAYALRHDLLSKGRAARR